MTNFSTPLVRRLTSVRRSGSAPGGTLWPCRPSSISSRSASSPSKSPIHNLHFKRQQVSRKDLRPRSRTSSTHTHPTIPPPPTYFPPPPPQQGPSFLRRLLRFTAISGVFFTIGFIMAAAPAMENIQQFRNPPTDEETLTLFQPDPESTTAEIEAYLQNHPYIQHLRQNTDLRESRPHLKIPEALRPNTLTAGTLFGENRIAVPPIQFADGEGQELITLYYLGKSLCGHPGLVHGGLLATLMDEGLARCCFESLPNKVGVTASLKVDYRIPCPAEGFVVLRARTTKTEGRKAWTEGKLMSLEAPDEWLEGEKARLANGVNGKETNGENGDKPVYDWGRGHVYVESEGLFIEPKQAATMKKLFSNKHT